MGFGAEVTLNECVAPGLRHASQPFPIYLIYPISSCSPSPYRLLPYFNSFIRSITSSNFKLNTWLVESGPIVMP